MDKKFFDALEIVLDRGRVSVAVLQRILKIGYARAGAMIDLMEEKNYISRFTSSGRIVFITKEFYEGLNRKAIEEGGELPVFDISTLPRPNEKIEGLQAEIEDLEGKKKIIDARIKELNEQIEILKSTH